MLLWRIASVPNIPPAMNGYSTLERAVLHRLAEYTGRAVDTGYAALVHQLGITQRFFQEGGFGDLSVVNFHEDVKLFASWPPEHFADVEPIQWRRVRRGTVGNAAYTVFQASFKTPCAGRAHDALPEESRTAHVRWIAPDRPAPGAPTAVHLAATGDHGFMRREHLAVPLVAQGIGSMALESPFYGLRKPPQQQGAKLRHVSDLLLLGRATIEESLFLLHWLGQRGHQRVGITGLSMGGVHASMVASLFPGPVALAPLLAPRSAANAYCRGALFHATAWDRLVRDTERRNEEILAAVELAAKGNDRLAAARVRSAALAAMQRAEGQASSAPEVAAVKEELAQVLPDQQPSVVLGVAEGSYPVGGTAGAVSPAPTGGSAGTSSGGSGGGGSGGEAASEAATTAWQWANIGAWASGWSKSLENQVGRLRRLEAEGGSRHKAAIALLEAVLETFTDATRFPVPRCPEAAVLVAATEDAYVSPESVVDLHRHLPGSEVRWVPGGHVSSFLLHQPTFRQAIADSLDRLRPPPCDL